MRISNLCFHFKDYNVIGAHPRIDPGHLVPKSDTLATRLRGQVMRGSK